jgi:photosystem II stability/assembly factor-like uncharacterized protein
MPADCFVKAGQIVSMPTAKLRLLSIGSLVAALAVAIAATPAVKSDRKQSSDARAPSDTPAAAAMTWRLVGPFRAGRVVAVAGVRGQPHTYYFGAVAGGVWKTTDGGIVWKPVFDAQPVQSIGAIAVAPSKPGVIYVGTGEADWRSDLSSGDGVYKSTDAGRSWQHLGLDETRHIARISINPSNPGDVLVAAMGHAYAANPERGIFRTTDGGRTWQKVLFKGEDVGAIDVVRQPSDPRIVYAALWSARRPPWSRYPPINGTGGGIYKSADGGATWSPVSGAGLPSRIDGRIGLAVADGNRVYALIDAEKPGLYRSDDAGASWSLLGTDSRITSRLWYFGELAVDPKNPDVVYAPNVGLQRSTDGGRTWTPIKGAPGGDDYHALWIDPDDPSRMITGVDQGATISVDGGTTWSSWYNQPTAQFYHVATDNAFPYRIYGAQQDSGTVGIVSRGNYGAITPKDWETVGGGESGYIVPDPDDPDVVYGGNTNGGLFRFERRTGQSHDIAPRDARGAAAPRREAADRFSWTSPLAFGPRRGSQPRAIYFGSQRVLKSVDRGQSWTPISGDLSRAGRNSAPATGGRMVQALAADEAYGVVYTIAPSALQPGLIWIGTDDGLIRITRDEGATWTDVTPPALSAWSKVSLIEASPHEAGAAYAAIDRHRLDDYAPHIYRTRDYGATWTETVGGLPPDAFVRAVREDPQQRGLLYAASERGVFVSFDDGESWESIQRNLPRAPIHDLVVHGNDLVAATHGRSFWVLDDVSPLRQRQSASSTRLLKPASVVRIRRSVNTDTPLPPEVPMGQNPPDGAVIDYELSSGANAAVIEIRDEAGQVVRRFSSADRPPPLDLHQPFPSYWQSPMKLPTANPGMNRFVWDLRYPSPRARRPDYTIAALPGDTPALPLGPQVVPGTYQVTLTVGAQSFTQSLAVTMDPRVTVSSADLSELFKLERRIAAAIDDDARALDSLESSPGGERARTLERLNDRLSQLLIAVDSADVAPTRQASAEFDALRRELDQLIAR